MPECLTIQFQLPEPLLVKCGANPGRKILGQMIEEVGTRSETGEAMLPFVHRIRRADGALQTMDGMSAFRVFGNTHSFYLSALGDEASQYLARNIHLVAGWLSRKAGTMVPMNWKGGRVDLTPSRAPNDYFINGFILSRSVASSEGRPRTSQIARHQALFDACDKRDPGLIDADVVADKIRRGLTAQCDVIGIDLPDDGVIIEVSEIPCTKLIEAVSGQFWPAINVAFRLNARLIGPWNIGPGASKGLGRVSSNRVEALEKVA